MIPGISLGCNGRLAIDCRYFMAERKPIPVLGNTSPATATSATSSNTAESESSYFIGKLVN